MYFSSILDAAAAAEIEASLDASGGVRGIHGGVGIVDDVVDGLDDVEDDDDDDFAPAGGELLADDLDPDDDERYQGHADFHEGGDPY